MIKDKRKITYYHPIVGNRITKHRAIKLAEELGSLRFQETITLTELKKHFPEEYKKLNNHIT